MPVLEPVERVLRVAEVKVERPVAQLEQVLHRRALAAPLAPRARLAAVGTRVEKNGHVWVLAISRVSARYFQIVLVVVFGPQSLHVVTNCHFMSI